MKKILFVIFNLDGGGAEKVLSDIVINLDKSKYKITVMTKYDSGVYIEDIKNHARYTPCFRRLVPGNNILKKTLNEIILNIREIILNLPGKLVYKIFIRDHYDIEIAFLEGWATKFISGSCSNESSKIAWVHTDMVSNPYADMCFKDLEAHRKSYTKFNKIICVSETCKLAFVNKFMISDNIYVVHNPINESNINSISSEEINDVEITNKLKIVSVGRLIPEKGYDRLLEIHKKLINDGFNYDLWIIGEGGQREKLEKYIVENRLDGTVKLLGFKKNPYKYIKKCDLFVCSSRVEGYSLVVAEAMILGLPVVSTDCAGPNELLNYGEFGLLVENNTEKLYEGLKKILSDEQLLEHYKNKAVERSRSFILKERMKEIEKVLEDT